MALNWEERLRTAKCEMKGDPRPTATGRIRGQCSLKLFCAPQILLCPEHFVLKHIIKTKPFPPQNVFCPQTLKPGYGPGLPTGLDYILPSPANSNREIKKVKSEGSDYLQKTYHKWTTNK